MSGSVVGAPSETPVAGHFIAGGWTKARADAVSTNPAHPREEVGRHALATPEELDRAVEAAHEAQAGWRRPSLIDRGRLLRRVAELLERRSEPIARLLTCEEGKTLPEARSEVLRAVETIHYHASRAWAATGETFASSSPEEDVRTVRVPVGVVGVITPWNFPLLIPAWKIAPALVYGNTVVWKPASHTPLVAVEFARILEECGAPAGIFNLVLGSGEVGRRLVDHPDVDAITFTGSLEVGRDIWTRATPRGVKVQLELGGHNAAIVFPDADLDLAARQIIAGAMLSAGQKCTATRRVIALSQVHDPLVERVCEEGRKLQVGDGLVDGVDVGPLVSRPALEEVAAEVQRARRQGADLLLGGRILDDPELDGGHFLAPTVFAVSDAAIRLCREEVFGPVTAVLEVKDDDEALELANATRYGLSASLFTRSERRVRRALEELDAGLISVNRPTTGSELHAPFGGMKASSMPGPREQGEAARDFYTELKTAYIVPGD